MKTKDIIICALFATLTGVLAQIAIPLPFGVPLTMQTFAVSLAGIMLGGRRGFISMLVYILMGAIGLPVFSNFSGGVGLLFGMNGGFILSFPLMAYVIGFVCERTNNKLIILVAMIGGSIVNYAFGVGQFMLVTGNSFYTAFMACVVPFIFTGLVKAFLATTLGERIKNHKGMLGILYQH